MLTYFWCPADPSNEEGFFVLEGFGLDRLGEEAGLMGIVSVEDDGELQGVDPPFCPVNLWLNGCEPGIAKNCLLFA